MGNKLKVFIAPQFTNPDNGDGGIRRVVEAQRKHLGDYGIDVVDNIAKADLTVGHGTLVPRRKGVPFISCCHGAHWADYKWGMWAHDVNGAVEYALMQADAITMPSVWVAQAITRGLMRNPTVIYHGIDADDWKHNKRNMGYVLWNKARKDQVSNPYDMQMVAKLLPQVEFRSTVGEDTENVKIFGVKPAEQMKPIIQRAGVYLATARETFGIGTLEALAAGVPVAGWDYGGQHEIIKQGETGYLAPYGDYAALADCISRCISERDSLSYNAVQDVRLRWQWPDKIEQYAELFKRVVDRDYGAKVSVIVTSHNLGRYLPHALESVLAQTLKDWECIITDDCSTDLTAEIAQEYCAKDKRFKYVRTPSNLGLCGALNFGFEKSRGRYVVNLDADNMLPPNALEIQADALELDPTVHIVSGDLDIVDENGNERKERIWHNKTDYNWRAQLAHINQIHSSSMMRREVRQLTGGYRERYWRAEDAHFWTLATSYGFRAKIVTPESTLIYRFRSGSKSAHEYSENPDRDGDWVADFPYRLASNPQDGARMAAETTGVPNPHTVPFSAQGTPTINSGLAWNVYHHEAPLVSVIIPVGKGHERLVIDALDSLQAQDFLNWEAVVVNDTPAPVVQIDGHAYARIVQTAGNGGPSKARNLGVRAARGKLIYFLDADDMLTPGTTLRRIIEAYIAGKSSYIYTDYIQLKSENKTGTLYQMGEYNQHEWRGQHGVNILIAKEDFIKVGGFDESLEGWEEWDLFSRLAIAGYCGKRLEIPGFIYRFRSGSQREKSFGNQPILLQKFRERYSAYYDGVKDMSGCCGGNGDVVLEARRELNLMGELLGDSNSVFRTEKMQKFEQTSGIQDKPVRMEFIGERRGGVTYFGKEGRQYIGGNNASEKYADVHPADVEKLELTGVWKVIIVEPQKVEETFIAPVLDLPIQTTVPITETVQGQDDMFPEPEKLAIAVVERKNGKRKAKKSATRKAKKNVA